MSTSARRAYGDLIIAQVAVALNTVVAKYLLQVMPVFVYLEVRFASTMLLLYSLMRLMKKPLCDPEHPAGRLEPYDWKILFVQAMSAGFLFNVLLMWGMQYTTATSAGIISASLPAMIAIMSLIFLKENLSLAKIFAIALAMIGILIISLDSVKGVSDLARGSLIGDGLVLLAIVPEALYSILTKLLYRRVDAMGSGMVVSGISALLILPFCLYQLYAFPLLTVPALAWSLLPVTVVCALCFYWLWGRGMQAVPGSTAALFGGVMPVATSLIACLALGEVFTIYNALGLLCVVCSIAVGTGLRWKRYPQT